MLLERQRGPDNDTEASSSCPQSDYAQDAHSQYILCFKNQTSVYCRFLLRQLFHIGHFSCFRIRTGVKSYSGLSTRITTIMWHKIIADADADDNGGEHVARYVIAGELRA